MSRDKNHSGRKSGAGRRPKKSGAGRPEAGPHKSASQHAAGRRLGNETINPHAGPRPPKATGAPVKPAKFGKTKAQMKKLAHQKRKESAKKGQ